MQVLVRRDVLQLDLHAGLNVGEWLALPVVVRVTVTGRVQYPPIIIIVPMRVEGDLLFYHRH